MPLVDACRIMAPTECGADDTSEPMAVDFAISSTPLTEEQYEKYAVLCGLLLPSCKSLVLELVPRP